MNKDEVLKVAGECGFQEYITRECSPGMLERFAAAMYAKGAEDMRERAKIACKDRADGLLSIIDLPVCTSAIVQRDRARQWKESAELVAALPITPKNTEGGHDEL